MAASGTFAYVAIVPDKLEQSTSPWTARLQKSLEHPDDPIVGSSLVGPSPTLQITDAGPVPKPSSLRPPVPRSRFTLTASSREHAAVSAASFYVDRRLISLLKPRDVLYMSRTRACGLAVSVLRDDELVAAAGAITAVPLGNSVQARVPLDLVKEAGAVFKRRDEAFEFPQLPIEITVEGEKCIMYGGGKRLGHYELYMTHGYYPPAPPGEMSGRNECMAIFPAAVHAAASYICALLLDGGPIEIVQWQAPPVG